jgi:tRNA dimethylallyltransferase
MTLGEAIAAASQGHRNYAKRQLTWFRREPGVHWIEDFGNAPETIAKAIALVQSADPQPNSLPS